MPLAVIVVIAILDVSLVSAIAWYLIYRFGLKPENTHFSWSHDTPAPIHQNDEETAIVDSAELDSVLEFVSINETTSIAVLKYSYDPDLKVIFKILDDETGLGNKLYKRAVRFKIPPRDTKRVGYVTMNNRHYILRTAAKQ